MSYQVLLFSKSGDRKTLPSAFVGTTSFTLDSSGNYTDATISLHADADSLVATGDRIEVWHSDVRRYRGYISEIRRTESEPAEIELTVYGRVLDLASHVLFAPYQYGNKVDISRIFAEIANEFRSRNGDIVIETETIGIELDSLDTTRKDVKSALDSLVAFARSRCVWGIDVDSTGRDRLFLRKIDAEATHTIVLPALASGERDVVDSTADVVNSVIIEGGTPDFPQLLPNPSFEEVWRATNNGAGNLLYDGGFEGVGAGVLFNFSDLRVQSEGLVQRVKSDSRAFIPSDVGKRIVITGGVGWTVGSYTIIAVETSGLNVGMCRLSARPTANDRGNGVGYLGSDDVWVFANGNTLCGVQDGIAPFAGSRQIKLDRTGDAVSQTRLHTAASPVVVKTDVPYTISFWMHPQKEIEVPDPPKITVALQWRRANGTAVGSPISKQFQCQTAQEWRQFDFTVQSPSDPLLNVAGYTLSLTDTSNGDIGEYREQSGALIDEVAVQNSSTYYPAGWQAVAFGAAKVDNLVCQPLSFGAFHGRNAVALQYRAKDHDNDCVLFRYSPSVHLQGVEWKTDAPDYTFQVIGGQRIHFSLRQYLQTGDAIGYYEMRLAWFRADNSLIRVDKSNQSPNPSFRDQWQYVFCEETAPIEASRCECYLSLRGDGTASLSNLTLIVDAISARNAEDPDVREFLDTGNLIIQFDAADLIPESESSAAFNSELDFGRREKVVSVSDITSISDARQWAREYLLVNAVATPAPTISVCDYPREIKCGDRVRLIGADGAWYSAEPLPVVRVQGEVGDDAILVYTLELVRPIPTEEELYSQLLNDKIRASTTVSGASAGSVPRGSSSSGGTVVSDASAEVKGVSRLSVAPSNPSDPIAAGTNDPRLFDARVPLPHSHPLNQIVGGTPNRLIRSDASGNLTTSNFGDNGTTLRLPAPPSGQFSFVAEAAERQNGEGTLIDFTGQLAWKSGGSFAYFGNFYNSSLGLFGFSSPGRPILAIDMASANVGIGGALSPAPERLWVQGSTLVDGFVRANGGYKSANGTQGASANTGGLQFSDGLYVGGSVAVGGGGSVTSVGLSAPSGFTVSGSPVTGSGTLALALSGSLSGLVKVVSGGLQNAVAGTDYAAASHNHTTAQITGLGTAAVRNVSASGNAAANEVVLGSDTRLGGSTDNGKVFVSQDDTEMGFLADKITPAFNSPITIGSVFNQNDAETLQLNLANSGVTAGNYSNTNITVDSTGRITSASNGTASGGQVTVANVATTNMSGPVQLGRNSYNRVDATVGGSGVALPYSTDVSWLGSTITITKIDASANAVGITIFGPNNHPNAGTGAGQNFAPVATRWTTAKFIYVQISSGNFAWERFV